MECDKRRNRRRLRLQQRAIGLLLLVICAAVLWFASTGTALEDRDGTAVLILGPLGLYMLFSRRIIIM